MNRSIPWHMLTWSIGFLERMLLDSQRDGASTMWNNMLSQARIGVAAYYVSFKSMLLVGLLLLAFINHQSCCQFSQLGLYRRWRIRVNINEKRRKWYWIGRVQEISFSWCPFDVCGMSCRIGGFQVLSIISVPKSENHSLLQSVCY
jgi:hypothetical protein